MLSYKLDFSSCIIMSGFGKFSYIYVSISFGAYFIKLKVYSTSEQRNRHRLRIAAYLHYSNLYLENSCGYYHKVHHNVTSAAVYLSHIPLCVHMYVYM